MMALSSMTPSSVKNIASSESQSLRCTCSHLLVAQDFYCEFALSGRKKKLINRNIGKCIVLDIEWCQIYRATSPSISKCVPWTASMNILGKLHISKVRLIDFTRLTRL